MRPSENKFYFVPLKKYEKVKNKKIKTPFIKIQSTGQLVIYRWCMEDLGFEWKPTIFKFYHDKDRRAIAFRVLQNVPFNPEDESVRMLNPLKMQTGSEYFRLSVSGFLNSLSRVEFPMPRLEIKEYRDMDTIHDKLYYVVIPIAKGKLLSEKKVEQQEETQ